MAGPRDFIRQAAKNRQADTMDAQARRPAPIPMNEAYPGGKAARFPAMEGTRREIPDHCGTPIAEPKQNDGENAPMQPVPRNMGGHALYRELMRSHDRMGTRHIGR